MSRSARQRAVAYADQWFSRYIRKRDRCSVLSGETEGLQCGHVFSRAAYSTRWDELNAFAQTAGENLRHEYDSYPFLQWFIASFGQETLDALYRKHRSPRKFTTEEIRAIGDYYRDRCRALDGEVPDHGIFEPVEDLSSWPHGFDVTYFQPIELEDE